MQFSPQCNKTINGRGTAPGNLVSFNMGVCMGEGVGGLVVKPIMC